jgi:hypothetical protein
MNEDQKTSSDEEAKEQPAKRKRGVLATVKERQAFADRMRGATQEGFEQDRIARHNSIIASKNKRCS